MRKIYISFLAALLATGITTISAGAVQTASELTDDIPVLEVEDDLATEDVLPDIEEDYVDNALYDTEEDDIAVITPELPATTLPDIVDDTMYEEDILPDEAIDEPPVDFDVELDDTSDFATSTPEENVEIVPSEPYVYPDSIDGWGVGGNGTEEVLEKYYGKFGYPEYISYVYNTGAEMPPSEGYEDQNICFWYYDVALTENTPENQQAVLDVAAENCYIRFTDARWSYNKRKAVYDELRAMSIEGMRVNMGQNIETIFVYLPDESEHFDDIPLYDGMVKVVPESEILEIDDSYDIGGTITTGIGGYTDGFDTPEIGIDEALTTGIDGEQQSGLPLWAWLGIVFIAFAAVGGAIVLIRRNRVSVNSDGSAEIAASASKNDVIEMISDSTEKPSDALKDKIMREIDK